MMVLLDPGHGGTDPGALSYDKKDKEARINLEIAKLVQSYLMELNVQALLTREEDIFKTPGFRKRLCDRLRPQCFVSIHCNSSSASSATGMEVIVRDEDDESLAHELLNHLIAHVPLPSRGIKNDIEDLKRKLTVLDCSHMPTSLVEVGFISNPVDYAHITNYSLMAEAITNGIMAWGRGEGMI